MLLDNYKKKNFFVNGAVQTWNSGIILWINKLHSFWIPFITWCKEWQMHLNTDTCEVMYVDKKVPTRSYYILDSADRLKILGLTTIEKDLGIMISNDLKPRAQIHRASLKANLILALLINTFVSKKPLLW